MLSMDTSDRAFICVRADGILRWRDYRDFELSLSNELRRRSRPAPFLLDLSGILGWSAAGLVRDIFLDFRHRASFSRIAILGNARWRAWIFYLAMRLFRARLRFLTTRDAATGRLQSRGPVERKLA